MPVISAHSVSARYHLNSNPPNIVLVFVSITVIPRLTKIIRFGITFVSRNLR